MYAALTALGILAVLVSLIALLFRNSRRWAKWSLMAGVAATITGAILFGGQMDDEARAQGYLGSADRRAAQSAGIEDPGAWGRRRQEEEDRQKAAAVASAAENEAKKAAIAKAIEKPTSQRLFETAVLAARHAYDSAGNDFQKGATRAQRRAEICRAMTSRRVADWIGDVYQLSSNSDGKGVLSIKIADDLWIKTWNNALSDIGDKTLVEPGTALFSAMMNLTEGQKVRFSGFFAPSEVDCLRETSMSLRGSMTEPEFIMKFQDIRAVTLPN